MSIKTYTNCFDYFVSLFASICYAANKDLDSIVKLRGVILQADGLTNIGIDCLSVLGQSLTSRCISNQRDVLADIGPQVIRNTASSFPYHNVMDNCDFANEHFVVEVLIKEPEDTSHLRTRGMTKAEAIELFHVDQVF